MMSAASAARWWPPEADLRVAIGLYAAAFVALASTVAWLAAVLLPGWVAVLLGGAAVLVILVLAVLAGVATSS